MPIMMCMSFGWNRSSSRHASLVSRGVFLSRTQAKVVCKRSRCRKQDSFPFKRWCQHPSNKFEILWQVVQNSFSLQISYFVAQYVLIIVVWFFLWKYILVFEKWLFSFDRSNMQIFTVNITRVVWPHVTNVLDLRYSCEHNPLFNNNNNNNNKLYLRVK